MTNVVFLCTGNAARSVMATVIARDRAPRLHVRGAGTFSIPGLPMSQRTREALAGMGLADLNHRSRQLEHNDVDWADVIIGFEPQHVEYVRREHAGSAPVAATLARLTRDLDEGPSCFSERLESLALADLVVEPWEELVDPAGGDQAVFDACLVEINGLLDTLLPRLDQAKP